MSQSQNVEVLKHLKRHGKITQLQALERYGVGRLAARINELRNAGHQIQTIPVTVKKRNGDLARVAEYRIKNASGSHTIAPGSTQNKKMGHES